MVKDNELVKITNRDIGPIGYSIEDLRVSRTFNPNETKTVTAEEIRKISYLPSGINVLRNNFIIWNEELVEEILHEVEPEYYYTIDDVKDLVLNKSYDEFLDALDFAPSCVIDIIKDLCVKLEVNDIRKREAVKQKTGFDVSKAIELEHEVNKDEEPESVAPARRLAVSAKTSTPGRRVVKE